MPFKINLNLQNIQAKFNCKFHIKCHWNWNFHRTSYTKHFWIKNISI